MRIIEREIKLVTKERENINTPSGGNKSDSITRKEIILIKIFSETV